MASCVIRPPNGAAADCGTPDGTGARSLGIADIAFIEGTDRVAVAGPGARGCPALFELSGRPGMLRLLDGTTIAIALRERSANSLPATEGTGCSALLSSTSSPAAMRVEGALRWLPMSEAARVVRRALGTDRRQFDGCHVLLFDVHEFKRISRNECQVLDLRGGT